MDPISLSDHAKYVVARERSTTEAYIEGLERQSERLHAVVALILSRAVHSSGGKAVRLGATTGLGAIPVVGLPVGLAASALDSFLLERLVPEPGPTAFLSRLYHSVSKAG